MPGSALATMGSHLNVSSKVGVRDQQETVNRLVSFIRAQAEAARADTLIVGMSGGLDSSVAAALSSMAVGGRKVLGLAMPESETHNRADLDDAAAVAEKYRIGFRMLDISSVMVAVQSLVGRRRGGGQLIAWGNIKARIRSTIAYYHANTGNGLVVGTGDKSELMLGYFTKYGDGACDIMPLGDLYKTSVKDLARHLGLPRRVIAKKPSPNLWPGQTAEQELGLDYETIDLILADLERWVRPKEIAGELSVPLSVVLRIRSRWLKNEHKRRLPLVPKLGFRTLGVDFRLPYNSAANGTVKVLRSAR